MNVTPGTIAALNVIGERLKRFGLDKKVELTRLESMIVLGGPEKMLRVTITGRLKGRAVVTPSGQQKYLFKKARIIQIFLQDNARVEDRTGPPCPECGEQTIRGIHLDWCEACNWQSGFKSKTN